MQSIRINEDVSRRAFVGAAAMGAAAAAVARAKAAQADEKASESEAGDAASEGAATAQAGDLVCDDGTVVPAVYVRLRNKVNRVGFGAGSVITAETSNPWRWYMTLFTPEEARHAIDMPTDRMFSAIEYSDITGLPEDEALQILEDMAHKNLLYRVRRGGVAYFHFLPDAHGLYEFNHELYTKGWLGEHTASRGSDFASALYNAETPMYRSVPISKDYIEDGTMATPYDDWEAVIRRNSVVAITPCQCRKAKVALETIKCDHPLGTCVQMGEMAEFYIENGIGEEVTVEEAVDIVRHSIDIGMAVEVANSTDCEVICSCHSDCCGLLGFINLVGGTGDAMENVSHYVMTRDAEKCIGCGACVERCVMQTLEMGDDGLPAAAATTCVGCGQCASVCPAGARVLKVKGNVPGMPTTLMDDYNDKLAARVKKGYVQDYEVGLGTCTIMDEGAL